MELTGRYQIPVPRAQVWQALNDPDTLRACLPGVESLEKVSETEFAATVAAKVGPVKARFSGRVTLHDLDPPNSYTIKGEGQGGVAGFAKGSADVALADATDADGGGTVLSYVADAQVGGKLAQIGSRLVAGTAKKMADEFFGALVDHIAPAASAADAATGQVGALSTPPSAARWTAPPWLWVSGLILLVAAILALIAA